MLVPTGCSIVSTVGSCHNQGLNQAQGLTNRYAAIRSNPDEVEELKLAFEDELEKIPEFENAKPLLEAIKKRTCIYAKECVYLSED